MVSLTQYEDVLPIDEKSTLICHNWDGQFDPIWWNTCFHIFYVIWLSGQFDPICTSRFNILPFWWMCDRCYQFDPIWWCWHLKLLCYLWSFWPNMMLYFFKKTFVSMDCLTTTAPKRFMLSEISITNQLSNLNSTKLDSPQSNST